MTELVKRTDHYITIQGGTNMSLEDYFVTYGVPTNRKIYATLPENSIIGATSTANYALITGDLSAYGEVELTIKGEIQAAGGITNGANGGNALHIDAASTNLSIILESTGAIKAGGAAGGKGGNGADGDSVPSWTGWLFRVYYPEYGWISGSAPKIYWISETPIYDNVNLEPGPYRKVGDYYYNKGVLHFHEWPYSYKVRRGLHYSGEGTAGTAGGPGQGYDQDADNGSDPSTAYYNAGKGARGGWGGTWGANGIDGTTGGTGYYYSTASSSNTRSGSGGSAAGSGGTAIVDDTSGISIINNGGTIVG